MDDKLLPVGIDNFEMMVTGDYYFVDKTLLIREFINKRGLVNLFTRPRRFGKTLNMSMLQYFFEDAREEDGAKKDNAYLFEKMNIMQTGKKYLSHMGQYPVISLSLKSARQTDFYTAYRMLVRQIADEFRRHRFVMQKNMPQEQRARYEEIIWEKAAKDSFADSLKFLSECLKRYYGKKLSY